MSILARYKLSRDPGLTVANFLDELLGRSGDREVSIEDGRPRTLAGLHAEVSALDSFLRGPVGLRRGQLVAIWRTNDPACFRWFLAVVRAGGVAVPLNPLLSLAEVRQILSRSGADILVTDRAVFARSVGSREELPVRVWIQADEEPDTLEGFLRPVPSGPVLPPAVVAPGETVAVFHTSGTSGFPKGAALSSRALLGARATSVLIGPFLGNKDLALIALPWSHIMAVSIALYGLLAGIRGCFLDRFDVDRALELVERHRVTSFIGVPAMFVKLVNSSPDPARLASIRLWLSASDHLPVPVRLRLRQYGALFRLPLGLRVPPVLLNGYGMVELGGLAMLGIETMFHPGSGDLCFPVPPIRVRVATEDGRPLPPGQVGECQVFRPGMTPGYWKDSEQSAGLLTADGWLRTGDLARRNRLGCIRLVGRSKDVIKSGGYSVYVREIEEALSAHPAVARAAAFGLPHEEKGEVPVAAVEIHPAFQAAEADLIEWCRLRLAPYKAPRRVWVLAPGDMPQNYTGKTLRRVLRQKFTVESV
jgi:acyl-CoA synthetase (AMP-forming)/AMP-acid ligase II